MSDYKERERIEKKMVDYAITWLINQKKENKGLSFSDVRDAVDLVVKKSYDEIMKIKAENEIISLLKKVLNKLENCKCGKCG